MQKLVEGRVSREAFAEDVADAKRGLQKSLLTQKTEIKGMHEDIMKEMLLDEGVTAYYQPYVFPVGERALHEPDFIVPQMTVGGKMVVFNPHYLEEDLDGKVQSHDVAKIGGFTRVWCMDGGAFYHIFITTAPKEMLYGKIIEGLDGDGGEVWRVRNGIKDPDERWQKEKKQMVELYSHLKGKIRMNPMGDELLAQQIAIAKRLRHEQKLRTQTMEHAYRDMAVAVVRS